MKTFCEQTFNSSHLQGLIQNLNLGDDTNVSNRWSIMHKRQKKLQTDRSFVFCFMCLDKCALL